MLKAKIENIMHENDIVFTVISCLKTNNIIEIGDKLQLHYAGLVDTLFGNIERIQELNNSLKFQTLPQTWNQGDLKCIVCKPTEDIIVGLFYHEYRNAIDSYHFGKQLNIIISNLNYN